MTLKRLLDDLRGYEGLARKAAIGPWAGRFTRDEKFRGPGDDAGAVRLGDGFLLLAAEGIWPTLLEDPLFAGFCSVTVNVNDIYAMGGRPLGLVMVVHEGGISAEDREQFLDGFERGLEHYGVPLLGGHTGPEGEQPLVSVAAAGYARHLLRGDGASPGDELLVALDLDGSSHSRFFAWDTVTTGEGRRTMSRLEALCEIAGRGICTGCRDISNPGFLGTAAMMMEASGNGAELDLDVLPVPPGVDMSWWLKAYPSYGFVLSVPGKDLATVGEVFHRVGVDWARVGTVIPGTEIKVRFRGESEVFLDWGKTGVTGIY